jgi:hypothetical protein
MACGAFVSPVLIHAVSCALTSRAVPATTAATPNMPRAHNVVRPRKVFMVLVVVSAVHWAQPRRLAPHRRYGRRQCETIRFANGNVGTSQSVRTSRAALHGLGRTELGLLSRCARRLDRTYVPSSESGERLFQWPQRWITGHLGQATCIASFVAQAFRKELSVSIASFEAAALPV